MDHSVQGDRHLRTDAERNRGRILVAARRLYSREGLHVPLARIAAEAQVGKATLNRRFPTRESLLTAVFAEQMERHAAAVAEALAFPDAWEGFIAYVEARCAMQAEGSDFADILTMTFPFAAALEDRRREAYEAYSLLVARAQRTGNLRADFRHEDIVLLFMANAGVVAATSHAAPDAWRRVARQFIRAFAGPGAPVPPLPEPPTRPQMFAAMQRAAPRP
ncbi:helix-turn-helix domain-containing protein [Aeromicrobium sp. IC_218]|uniref:TetR/AcrR family transcriptional regulator n=1 Tax=Aeromicrobium sp. IC_218 TaxID=2545468 RepID=UPI0010408DA6|nr:helix-turn-helix domain-containing protein [Aeromicrobium sp. IC_218]TCI96351.1 TetR/AcrR family transcriptional regulator [Aeromicrobium sp. IC_218]